VHLLVALGIAELIVHRLLPPVFRPVVPAGQPIPLVPLWAEAIGWLGVFLHYFLGTLAIALLAARAVKPLTGNHGRGRGLALSITCGAVAALAAAQLVIGEGPTTAFLLETALVLTALTGFVVSIRWRSDTPIPRSLRTPLGRVVAFFARYSLAVYGLGLIAAAYAIHYAGVLGSRFWWSEDLTDLPASPTAQIAQTGLSIICLAAITSPYAFGPRPFSRAVIRLAPIAVAMTIAAAGALIARRYYVDVVGAVANATGIQLATERPDPNLALYILALATIAWTLASCAIAEAPARRRLGLGLALIVLGGYHEIVWPAYYAMIAVGIATIVDAVPELREQEHAGQLVVVTPPVEDHVWQGWVTTLVRGLRAAGHAVNGLTARGDDDHTTTILNGDVAARPFRLRIDRIRGAVIGVDVRFGKDLGDDQPATFTVAVKRGGRESAHPAPPPAGSRIEVDAEFDDRFRSRGDRTALAAVLDPELRVRLTATIDGGWLAVWKGESVRLRIYPGQGAPIDRPIPLPDLELRRAGPDAADRLIATVAVLADVARATVPAVEPEPAPAADAPDDPSDPGLAAGGESEAS
jgi:hypothetical protein